MTVKISRLPASLLGPGSHPDQGRLDLAIERDAEISDFGMGVLSDGTPFLTQRGLAVLCGVENAHIGTISLQWFETIPKPRINKIRDILSSHGYNIGAPHFELTVSGRSVYGYPEEICLSVLEYYAFEAGQFCQEEAKANFRKLAGKGLRDYIYSAIGYEPERDIDDQWCPFHDRVSLAYHSAPVGFFSIFKETAEITVTMGQNGIFANDAIIPDISIGKNWSSYWKSEKLESKFGARLEYEHYYPSYFPQAASNPQSPWCYPESALGEFRRWLRDDYIRGGKFQTYIKGQVQKRQISSEKANAALQAYDLPKLITDQRSS